MGTRQEYDKMKHLYQDEEFCPFCPRNRKEIEAVLWEGKYWTVIPNKYPYLGIKKHLLLIPNRHLEFTTELNTEERVEMEDVEKWLKNFFKETSFFSFIRQIGEMKSIKHLHYHYLPGEVTVEGIESMLLPQINLLGGKQ